MTRIIVESVGERVNGLTANKNRKRQPIRVCSRSETMRTGDKQLAHRKRRVMINNDIPLPLSMSLTFTLDFKVATARF